MQTQSDPIRTDTNRGEWSAQTNRPKRSVFGNYRPEDLGVAEASSAGSDSNRSIPGCGKPDATLQGSIDVAVARAFIYRYLAKAYEDPTPESWQWLCDASIQQHLNGAWVRVGKEDENPKIRAAFDPDSFNDFLNAYLAAFGHAARGACPLNEIEYGDIKADPLFQPHRLADLGAFYQAYGLELTPDAGERQDHICLEMEFMCVMAAKEAYALEHQLDADQLIRGRDAQKKFLREHPGRWTPAFTRRLAAATNNPSLRTLADFTRAFMESECARFGVTSGSEELCLRPVDEAADRMCDSCGVNQLPPGALTTT